VLQARSAGRPSSPVFLHPSALPLPLAVHPLAVHPLAVCSCRAHAPLSVPQAPRPSAHHPLRHASHGRPLRTPSARRVSGALKHPDTRPLPRSSRLALSSPLWTAETGPRTLPLASYRSQLAPALPSPTQHTAGSCCTPEPREPTASAQLPISTAPAARAAASLPKFLTTRRAHPSWEDNPSTATTLPTATPPPIRPKCLNHRSPTARSLEDTTTVRVSPPRCLRPFAAHPGCTFRTAPGHGPSC
jgi:hypothetical protein